MYFHVIEAPEGTGAVSAATIDQQIAVLNLSFSGFYGGYDTGFRFRLAGSETTVNDAWLFTGTSMGDIDPGGGGVAANTRAVRSHYWGVSTIEHSFVASQGGGVGVRVGRWTVSGVRSLRTTLPWIRSTGDMFMYDPTCHTPSTVTVAGRPAPFVNCEWRIIFMPISLASAAS